MIDNKPCNADPRTCSMIGNLVGCMDMWPQDWMTDGHAFYCKPCLALHPEIDTSKLKGIQEVKKHG